MSDAELPLPLGEGLDPDVVIQRRNLTVQPHEGGYGLKDVGNSNTVYLGDRGNVITGRIYEDLLFVVEEGASIYYNPLKSFQVGELQGYLTGVLMATLLRQRGFLVLHACSVAKDGRAVAFVGESGWGKSTLAEYFCQRGYTLLSDDVLAIEVKDGAVPHVVPGYPQIRLRTEAGRHLRKDFDQLPLVNEMTAKRFTTPSFFPTHPLPLQKLYLLDPGFTDTNALEPVSARSALLRLIQHARATNLIKAPAFQAKLLRQCERVVRSIAVQRLRRVRDLNRLHEIHQFVEHDLSAPRNVEADPSPDPRSAAR